MAPTSPSCVIVLEYGRVNSPLQRCRVLLFLPPQNFLFTSNVLLKEGLFILTYR